VNFAVVGVDMFADFIVVVFYIFTFTASALVIAVCSVLGFFEVRGYLQERAELKQQLEELKDEFN
jgi:hypothetical protein